MKSKKGYEFSFAWIFAILVGGVVIYLAIYSVGKFVEIYKYQQGSEAGKEIGVLLTPFETNFESGKINFIKTRGETTIYNDCVENGEFGEQKISTSVKSGIGNKEVIGAKSSFKNRYLFSSDETTGKEFYVLSKPFEFPFKVGDLIIVWSDKQKYCFLVDTFPELKKEINNLGLKNVVNVSSIRDCKDDEIKVCFRESSECDIIVDTNQNSVEHIKKDKKVYYTDLEENGLLYAAIFSSPEVYNCQIKRLMKRASNLAEIYVLKSQFLEPRGCGAIGLNSDFLAYKLQIERVIESNEPDIRNIEDYAKELEDKNDMLICKIF